MTKIDIHKGHINLEKETWSMTPSKISKIDKYINVDGFEITSQDKYLTCQGEISSRQDSQLKFGINNFDLGNFASVILKNSDGYNGILSGELLVKDFYNSNLLFSDLKIEKLGVFNYLFGDLSINSTWNSEKQNMTLSADIHQGQRKSLLVKGDYNPITDSIDMAFNLYDFGLEGLGAYLKEDISNLNGRLSGDMNVIGRIDNPIIYGNLDLRSVEFLVNTLNTTYKIDDELKINDNRIYFENFVFTDVNKSRAWLNGSYGMTTGDFNLNASFKDFLVLDKDASPDTPFYGKLKMSGIASVNNKNGGLNVVTTARSEGLSQLFVPLKSNSDEMTNNFLHFIGKQIETKIKSESSETKLTLDANLEVRDDMEIQVVFDPTVGDILKVKGNGNIRMSINKEGDLQMFGEYKVSKGDYLFTLSNLVNKKFVLSQGGVINWSGSPYDAMLDMSAVYNTKASLSDLLPLESTNENIASESTKKIPVECVLSLQEKLTNPTIGFDINFPSLDSQSRSYIESLFSSQDEVNKQMLSLLILNKFYRSDDSEAYGAQVQTAGLNTLTEMLSNQLSRWVSQFTSYLDVDLAYKLGDTESGYESDELQVGVSTQLFNERVVFSAQGNMGVGNNPNVEADKNEFLGDFDLEIKLNKQGSLKLKAYSHSDERIQYNRTDNVQGIGVSYSESFDTFGELFNKYIGFLKRKDKK